MSEWSNHLPTRKEIEQVIASLRVHADAIEADYIERAARGEDEKRELLKEAREAIEKAKASGHRWQLWERIVDEWVAGSSDDRGTPNDRLRRMASYLDRLGPTMTPMYSHASVSYHPMTVEDACEMVAALRGRWTTKTGGASIWIDSDSHDVNVTIHLRHRDWLAPIREVLTPTPETVPASPGAGSDD